MNRFVRLETVTGEAIAFNTSFVVTARPSVDVVDVIEGILCYRKRFHVAGVTCLKLSDGQEYEILGTLDQVQAAIEGNGTGVEAAFKQLRARATPAAESKAEIERSTKERDALARKVEGFRHAIKEAEQILANLWRRIPSRSPDDPPIRSVEFTDDQVREVYDAIAVLRSAAKEGK